MPIRNNDIAAYLTAIAIISESEGENPFKIRAYRNASRTIRGLARSCGICSPRRGADRLPGIGKELAAKIVEILETVRPRP